MKKGLLALASVLTLFLTGCATNVSTFTIDTSNLKSENQSETKTVYVRNIIDAREFDTNTKDPSIPSVEYANSSEKDHAIGRKRNTWGKALGSLVLTPEQTVSGLTREVVEYGLQENGWKVVRNQEDVTSKTLVVDVTITKWWAWMNPGFWQITLSSNMAATVQPTTNKAKKVEIASLYKEGFQTGLDDNWLRVLQGAFDSLVRDSKEKMATIK